MIIEDQSDVVSFLSSPATHDGAAVERIDTHASIVFLAGQRALKLKRAVRYDYLDFSTAERRRAMCEAELRINRPLAPAIYRGVTAVTREADGRLTIGGAGMPVEWLVEMARFDQNDLFDRLAESGVLPLQLMQPLAEVIARMHATADCRIEHGGWAAMERLITGNAAAFAADGAGILDPIKCAGLTSLSRLVLDRNDILLESRRNDGQVRRCHGDLHLSNILLLDGRPTLFDAIEFNDEIACVDVLYDLAFPLMDLWRLGLPNHANALWNAYLARTGEFEGVQLMPLFMSCRAAVGAKTTAAAATLEAEAGRRAELTALARDYLALAARLLEPSHPKVIAVGGRSGSGKSTLAMALAPSLGSAPGAVVIRSDEIRKQLCGVQPLDRLGPEAYTDDVSRRVYEVVMQQADTIVRGGFVAIADAVFSRAADRDAIKHVATAAGVPFVGLWLHAPERTLIARVEARGADASDADADVIRRQLVPSADCLQWDLVDASATRQQLHDSVLARYGLVDSIHTR